MLPALIPLALTLVPDLVKAIAGDTAGKVAEAAASAVAAVTGTDDPAQAQERLSADPALAAQVRIRLAEIAAEQARAERQADLDEQRALLADLQSARAQTVALAQAGSAVQWAPVVVSVMVTLAFAGALALVLSRTVPQGAETMVNVLLGTLAAAFTQVVNYWLGSSSGSARKDMRAMATGAR